MSTGDRVQPWQLGDLPLHRLLNAARRVDASACHQTARVAILGDAATQHYRQALDSVLKLRGIWPETYEAEFDLVRQEALESDSGLYRHEPRFVVLLMTTQAAEDRWTSAVDRSRFAEAWLDEMQLLWGQISARTSATIVQHTLPLPVARPRGNQTIGDPSSWLATVSRINAGLAEAAREGRIRLVDAESLASYYGRQRWFDERLWCEARQALSPAYLPPLAKAASDVIAGDLGFGVKCVVVDLDNTLWGGTLADDGIEGIEVGQTEVGLAFLRFQRHLLELRARGVLLAVCSKNEQAAVERALDDHPDMLLRRSDFACCVANYDTKVANIMAIREALNIGFDSMVFLDDSPFERDMVRAGLPSVQVPEFPDDPADVMMALAKWNLFEAAAASTSEDGARNELYRTEAERAALRGRFTDLKTYLADLAMEADVRPIEQATLPRALQLVQRSNQFNLTTIRYSAAELAAMAAAPDVRALTIRLRDRLGDNGIIAVLILRVRGNVMLIDTWIMSCRVLGRTVEEFTIGVVADEARRAGCSEIRGVYAPTAKNGLVATLYPRLGFAATGTGEAMEYTADLASWSRPEHVISPHARKEQP